MDPYSWYTNTGRQYRPQQIAANPNYAPQKYGNAQNLAQPQNNYQYVEQAPNSQSSTMISNSAGAQDQNAAVFANASNGVTYMQAYDREQPQSNNLLTQYRTAHHRSPGGKLRNTAQRAPTSILFGSKWW